jgi:hypothetical protein
MQEHRLEPRLVQGLQEISRELLTSADVDVVQNLLRNSLIVRVQRTIMAERVDKQVHEWVEEPIYESARHHYLDSLPHGFRRRLLGYFWGIDDSAPLAKRRRHTVVVNRWVKLPDIAPSMGARYFEQTLDEESGWV